ncbi:unnamed protein product [Lepidochelys olivacea]
MQQVAVVDGDKKSRHKRRDGTWRLSGQLPFWISLALGDVPCNVGECVKTGVGLAGGLSRLSALVELRSKRCEKKQAQIGIWKKHTEPAAPLWLYLQTSLRGNSIKVNGETPV